MRAQAFLEIFRVREFGYVLEFIYADDNFQPFFRSDSFCKIQNFIGTALQLFPIEFYRHLIHGSRPYGDSRYQAGEEFLCVFHRILPSGGSGGNDLSGQQRVEMFFVADIEKIQMAYAQIGVLSRRKLGRFVDKRTLPPAARRDDYCVCQ